MLKIKSGVRSRHYLLSAGPPRELDLWASVLASASGGRLLLTGDYCRGERNAMAAELDGGVLAAVLVSDRPIRVDAGPDYYLIEEL